MHPGSVQLKDCKNETSENKNTSASTRNVHRQKMLTHAHQHIMRPVGYQRHSTPLLPEHRDLSIVVPRCKETAAGRETLGEHGHVQQLERENVPRTRMTVIHTCICEQLLAYKNVDVCGKKYD